MRVFIAIEVPDEIKELLAAAQALLRSAGVEARWPPPAGLHLTLKFLGEVAAEHVPEIMRHLAIASSGTGRFRLGLAGVGTFPSPEVARVVWFGVTGDIGALIGLQAAIDQAMSGLGSTRDDRPYTPHLTLGRIKRIRNRDRWLQGLEEVNFLRLSGFDVTSIRLVSSDLRATGAVYRELGKVFFDEGRDQRQPTPRW